MRNSRATTTYLYDSLGRLAMETDALGNATLWSYDQFDQVTEQALPDSTPEVPRVATYTYDNYGKLISQAGTGQYPVTYTYDGAGNQVSLTNGNGSKTQWSYDGLNRVTGKTYSDGSKYGYHYDQAGNLTQRTDAKGQTTQYAYNAYHLVSQISYPTNAPVQFTYDLLGRRTGMSDSTGTDSWNWNSAGENIGYSQNNVNTSIQYSYKAEAQRTQMSVGVSNATPAWTTSYTYDAAARLNGILDNKISTTNPFSYAYTPNTNWIAGHSNADGSAVLNQYDVLGRLTSISAANSSKVAINTYSYTYDAAGQRTQEASTVGTRDFSYDDQRQLTSAYRIDGNNNPIPSYDYNYNFDAIGNWTKLISPAGETDITSNGLNQYIKFMGSAIPTPQTPTYDLNGNMITDGKGNTYVYDEENRLIEADTPNTTITKVISVYDGLSRRVEKRTFDSSGTLLATTRYLYDGLLPIAEYNASNNVTKTYTRGLDLSQTLQGAGGIGGLLAITDSTGSYSYFTDGNGNITDLTSAYGTVVSHSEYDPFGNVVATTGTYQQSYGWSSKENDGNGFTYYLYRFYNPSLGRWVNRDPIGEVAGLNLYNLVNNRVTKYFDSNGDVAVTVSIPGGVSYSADKGNNSASIGPDGAEMSRDIPGARYKGQIPLLDNIAEYEVETSTALTPVDGNEKECLAKNDPGAPSISVSVGITLEEYFYSISISNNISSYEYKQTQSLLSLYAETTSELNTAQSTYTWTPACQCLKIENKLALRVHTKINRAEVATVAAAAAAFATVPVPEAAAALSPAGISIKFL